MVTIKEIAHRSGFSQATVSRLLNNDSTLSVTTQTRNTILAVATDLGYWKDRPHPRVTANIALLYQVNPTEHLDDVYFTSLRDELEQQFSASDMKLKVFTNLSDLLDHSSSFQAFVSVGSEGLSEDDLYKLHSYFEHGVFLEVNPAPHLFDSIQPNLALAVDDAYHLLKMNGQERIGFIGGWGESVAGHTVTDPREVIFHHLMNNDPLAGPIIASGPFNIPNSYQLGKKFLASCQSSLPDAVIVASDTLSVGVLQAFNEANILVPRDIKLISINDSAVARYVSPPLTTYRIDQAEMCHLALTILQDSLTRNQHVPLHIAVNTQLVVRKSFVPKNSGGKRPL